MLGTVVAFEWLADTREAALHTSGGALVALSYVSNWTDIFGYYQGQIFGHTWSLSIEEQFYLLWPLCLVLLLRRTPSRASMNRIVVLAIFLALLWRLIMFCNGANNYRISRGTDTRADSLLMGSVVGILFASGLLPKQVSASRWIKSLASLAVSSLIFVACYPRFSEVNENNVVYIVVSSATAMIILHLVASEASALRWILSRPWLVYVGKISYGLYLWHYPIFRLTELKQFSRSKELGIEVALSVSLTLLSFYLLERPLLRHKRTPWHDPAPAL
jgi:peptidoglycan/LPS O-acetylase OafA/YrhL